MSLRSGSEPWRDLNRGGCPAAKRGIARPHELPQRPSRDTATACTAFASRTIGQSGGQPRIKPERSMPKSGAGRLEMLKPVTLKAQCKKRHREQSADVQQKVGSKNHSLYIYANINSELSFCHGARCLPPPSPVRSHCCIDSITCTTPSAKPRTAKTHELSKVKLTKPTWA